MVGHKKAGIGELLIADGIVTEQQFAEALSTQKNKGGKIGDVFVKLGFATERDVLVALSKQLKVPFIELEHFSVDPKIVCKLPERIARKFKTLLLEHDNRECLIGMADPTDILAYDEVSRFLNIQPNVALVSVQDVTHIIDQTYRRTADIASFAEEIKEEKETTNAGAKDAIASLIENVDLSSDSSALARLLDSIFEDAIQVGASDIHIEPEKDKIRIRQRVDGILYENIIQSTEAAAPLVLRVKILAKLDISEKRLPQDGRFHIRVKGHEIDVRVSIMPIQDGEAVVMRLLDQTQGILALRRVLVNQDLQKQVRSLISRPSGLILVTGPTGSGKTTTLYAMLNELNRKEKKIITIEDPIEYALERINQVQVNTGIDLTFASVLRTTLRQDPDIVMIGEMRDQETASIGLRAAMTGHLVLSTLHTNDAISSAVRLIDMGAEGYLVAGSLRAVIAQRLIRRLCDSCAQETPLTDEEEKMLTMVFGSIDDNWKFKKGVGCTRCNNTGYKGRMAVHELLEIRADLADALRVNDGIAFAEAAHQQSTFKPLAVCAIEYALAGKTTIEEVMHVAGEMDETRRRFSRDPNQLGLDLSKISV